MSGSKRTGSILDYYNNKNEGRLGPSSCDVLRVAVTNFVFGNGRTGINHPERRPGRKPWPRHFGWPATQPSTKPRIRLSAGRWRIGRCWWCWAEWPARLWTRWRTGEVRPWRRRTVEPAAPAFKTTPPIGIKCGASFPRNNFRVLHFHGVH